jgi:hypothetical protein
MLNRGRPHGDGIRFNPSAVPETRNSADMVVGFPTDCVGLAVIPIALAQEGIMNISAEEAMSLLGSWKNEMTPLKIHSSRSGARQDLQGVIQDLKRTIVVISSASGELQLDLEGAEFNGGKPASGSDYSAYLICEFRNGDRCSFHALRSQSV